MLKPYAILWNIDDLLILGNHRRFGFSCYEENHTKELSNYLKLSDDLTHNNKLLKVRLVTVNYYKIYYPESIYNYLKDYRYFDELNKSFTLSSICTIVPSERSGITIELSYNLPDEPILLLNDVEENISIVIAIGELAQKLYDSTLSYHHNENIEEVF